MDAADVRVKRYDNDGNQALLRLVPADARRVLDVGCGSGGNARRLARLGLVVDGITLSSAERDEAAPWCRSCVVVDLEQGLPANLDGTYDVILCSHVLEHLRWPERLLRQLRDTLSPSSGRLLVAVPNVLFYTNRAHLLAGRFDYQDAGLMDASHFRWFTFRTARKLIESCGFKVTAHLGDGHAPLPIVRRVLPGRVSGMLDALATRCAPGLFSYQVIIAACRP